MFEKSELLSLAHCPPGFFYPPGASSSSVFASRITPDRFLRSEVVLFLFGFAATHGSCSQPEVESKAVQRGSTVKD